MEQKLERGICRHRLERGTSSWSRRILLTQLLESIFIPMTKGKELHKSYWGESRVLVIYRFSNCSHRTFWHNTRKWTSFLPVFLSSRSKSKTTFDSKTIDPLCRNTLHIHAVSLVHHVDTVISLWHIWRGKRWKNWISEGFRVCWIRPWDLFLSKQSDDSNSAKRRGKDKLSVFLLHLNKSKR